VWGTPVSTILTEGDVLIRQAFSAEQTGGLVSVLLEGNLPPFIA
jgi:hypothetical protein